MLREISILQAAALCGITCEPGNFGAEVRAKCPFCGDNQPRLYLNTAKNVFHCQHCKKSGNSVTLYAERHGIGNAAAYRELTEQAVFDCPPLPICPPRRQETELKPIDERDLIYREFLHLLELEPKHRFNLQNRGLDADSIERNLYRSVPKKYGKVYSRAMYLLSEKHDLFGVPGFYRRNGQWHMVASSGFFIPVRDAQDRIQGLQIRLDDAAKQKYKWFSGNGCPCGTKCPAFLHVVNWREGAEAYVTEGALKADVAFSLMGQDVCFVALPGVGATKGLEELLRELDVSMVSEAFDMDKETNPTVRLSVQRFYALMEKLGIAVRLLKWDPRYKGIDDLALAEKGGCRRAA